MTSIRRTSTALVAILLLTAALTTAMAPAAPDPLRADFHNCGDIPALTTWDVRAKRVSCRKAKRVVRAYNAALGPEGSSTQDVMGFHCKISGGYYDGAYYRCAAAGHKVIRFTRGG
jgi:hypothetical protein